MVELEQGPSIFSFILLMWWTRWIGTIWRGHYLLTNNAPITHSSQGTWASREPRLWVLVSSCIFFLLESHWRIWSKVKVGVRRNALTADDRLSDRTCESAQMVTRAGCQACVHHAVSFFPRCKREDINLWEDRRGYSGCILIRESEYVGYILLADTQFNAWLASLRSKESPL
jgi:hypothetical protein